MRTVEHLEIVLMFTQVDPGAPTEPRGWHPIIFGDPSLTLPQKIPIVDLADHGNIGTYPPHFDVIETAGKRGWELVQMTPSTSVILYIFKRAHPTVNTRGIHETARSVTKALPGRSGSLVRPQRPNGRKAGRRNRAMVPTSCATGHKKWRDTARARALGTACDDARDPVFVAPAPSAGSHIGDGGS